jgi:hypothetical protein
MTLSQLIVLSSNNHRQNDLSLNVLQGICPTKNRQLLSKYTFTVINALLNKNNDFLKYNKTIIDLTN